MLAALLVGPVLAEEDARPSGTLEATRLMRIECPPDVFRLGAGNLDEFIGTSLISGAAAQEVFGDKAPFGNRAWGIEYIESNDDSGLIILEVDLEDAAGFYADGIPPEKALAEEYADAICERFAKQIDALAELREDDSEETLRELMRERDLVRNELEAVRDQLEALTMRQALSGLAGDEGRSILLDLSRRELDLQMRVKVSVVRAEAIEIAVAELAKENKVKVEDDRVLDELLRVREIRQQQLDQTRMLVDTAQAGKAELLQAELLLAEADARLAEHRERLRQPADGGLAQRLRGRLVELEVDRRANQESLELIAGRIDEAREHQAEGVQRAAKIQELRRDMESMTMRLRSIDSMIQELRLVSRSQRIPSLTVLESE